MRIGLFSDTYTPYISGVVTSISILKSALEDLGHEVYVVTINQDGNRYSYDDKEKILRIGGIETGLYDGVKVTGIYPIRATNKIKKWNLDIIHSHTEFSIGTFARIISKQLNIPIVHTYHTMYEDYVYLITKGLFDKPAKKIVEYFTLFYCDKTVSELIVPTKKAYDLFKIKYKINRNIHIIPTGSDIEKFDKDNFDKKDILELRRQLGIEIDDFVLLSVSRISKEKNLEFIMDAYRVMSRTNKKLKLLIIGDGPCLENYKKRYEKTKGIIFVGKVPWDKIPLYYQAGDVFVTASKTETQGLTVNEALSSSLPAICIEDDSFKLSVMDDFNGYFFKNRKEFNSRISNLIQNRELYNRLSKQAKNSSIKFSKKYFAESILEVYNMSLEKKKKNIIEKIKDFMVRKE